MRRKTAVLAIVMSVLVIVLSLTMAVSTAFAEDQIQHSVITTANYGEDIIFNADVVYDLGTSVISAKVYYNTYGKSNVYKSLDMINSSANTYTATLQGKWAVVPYIYYYIEIVTDSGTINNGNAADPYRISVSQKAGYVAPQIMISEAIAINGNRADFVEMKNIGNTAIDLSKLSLKMNEYICNGTVLTIDESAGNYKGEIFLALNGSDNRSKVRITSSNEVSINPGETFIIFTGKTADAVAEQGGLASTATEFNFDYLVSQYTAARVGTQGSNIEGLSAIENTRAFLAVSDPYTVESSIIPDPSATYTATAYGTLWTVIYDGNVETRVVVGFNNDGTAQLTDKSTKDAYTAIKGFGSVQYSPYFVDVTYDTTTISIQSRLTDAREVGISIGVDKVLPSLNLIKNSIDLDTITEVKDVLISDFIGVNDGGFYDSEYNVAYTVRKGEEIDTVITGDTFQINGEGVYTLTATFTSSEFTTFTESEVVTTMVDTEAPILSNLNVTSNVTYCSDITFSVTITDNKALTDANLLFKYAENANWTTVDLVSGENDTYSYTISNVKVPKVFYYIEASDLIGNVGRIALPDAPNTIDISASTSYSVPELIITEANAIKSKRAGFLEIYNNSNKPIALSDVVVKRYDYIIDTGVFSVGYLTRTANGTSTIAICDSNEATASRTQITESNEVYIPSGTTFVVFLGNMNAGELALAPYNLNYIRNFYNEISFPGINLSNIIDNVNAFVATIPMAGSPTYTETKYGTAYSVEYKGEEVSVAVVGMNNNGGLSLDASINTTAADVGSVQFSDYTMDIILNGVTETFQTKISDNKQAIISFNAVSAEQIPSSMYIVSPEVTLQTDTQTIYGMNGTFDLTSLFNINSNGYDANEYVISGKENDTTIVDIAQYAYSVGNKTITFTVSSPTSVFTSYDLTLNFVVIDTPLITANDTNTGILIYGQIDTIEVSDYFTIVEGGFAGLYNITLESNLPLVNNTIQIAGDYQITITVSPVNAGAFENIEKTILINVTANTAPSITANNSNVNEMITAADFDLAALFTIDKGTFNSATIVWTITKDSNPVVVTGSTISAIAGEYKVSVSVNPENVNDFTAVESTEVTLTLAIVTPSIDTTPGTVVNDEVSITLGNETSPIDLTEYFDITDNSFDTYTVTYTVIKDGSPVTLSNNIIPNIAGVYEVTVTIAADNSEFTDITKSITVTVIKNIPTLVTSINKTFEVKKGTAIDFNEFITITNNDYVASEYAISYSVTLNGKAQELTGTKFIANEAGEYIVTVTLTANDSSFTTITNTFNITTSLEANMSLYITLSVVGILIVAGVVVLIIIKNKKKA